jgi:hypothetical protein
MDGRPLKGRPFSHVAPAHFVRSTRVREKLTIGDATQYDATQYPMPRPRAALTSMSVSQDYGASQPAPGFNASARRFRDNEGLNSFGTNECRAPFTDLGHAGRADGLWVVSRTPLIQLSACRHDRGEGSDANGATFE